MVKEEKVGGGDLSEADTNLAKSTFCRACMFRRFFCFLFLGVFILGERHSIDGKPSKNKCGTLLSCREDATTQHAQHLHILPLLQYVIHTWGSRHLQRRAQT